MRPKQIGMPSVGQKIVDFHQLKFWKRGHTCYPSEWRFWKVPGLQCHRQRERPLREGSHRARICLSCLPWEALIWLWMNGLQAQQTSCCTGLSGWRCLERPLNLAWRALGLTSILRSRRNMVNTLRSQLISDQWGTFLEKCWEDIFLHLCECGQLWLTLKRRAIWSDSICSSSTKMEFLKLKPERPPRLWASDCHTLPRSLKLHLSLSHLQGIQVTHWSAPTDTIKHGRKPTSCSPVGRKLQRLKRPLRM